MKTKKLLTVSTNVKAGYADIGFGSTDYSPGDNIGYFNTGSGNYGLFNSGDSNIGFGSSLKQG